MAEITWLGHACFRLKGKDATIITDPYDRSLGLGTLNQKADIVTISHEHAHHNTLSGIKGEPFVVRGPGEYEVRGVFITGVWTFADNEGGKERGRNNVFLFHLDDLVVCHLGSLGHTLNSHQIEALGDVDVLMVPVGGNTSLTATKATEVISQLEPKVVIPMHYGTGREQVTLDTLEKFMKEMGLKEWEARDKLTLRSSDLGETTQVMVLEART
ncbi:MAG TPA: MBL fold metallo-hydrolase [Chloroflexia bacterium]|nr:MBL fold metallo-hydrolase [Chloroflexia bacterium]